MTGGLVQTTSTSWQDRGRDTTPRQDRERVNVLRKEGQGKSPTIHKGLGIREESTQQRGTEEESTY